MDEWVKSGWDAAVGLPACLKLDVPFSSGGFDICNVFTR